MVFEVFKEVKDEIEVKGMYAVDEGMPIDVEVKMRGELEGTDKIKVEMGCSIGSSRHEGI